MGLGTIPLDAGRRSKSPSARRSVRSRSAALARQRSGCYSGKWIAENWRPARPALWPVEPGRAHIGGAASWRFTIDTARDVAIIILAIFNVIQALVLTALFVGLFILVRKAIAVWPKLESIIDKVSDTTTTVQQTTHNVSTTTTYVTGNVVAPLVKVIAFIMGVRRTLEVLFTGPQPSDVQDRGIQS